MGVIKAFVMTGLIKALIMASCELHNHHTTDTLTANIQPLLALLGAMHEVISIATVLSKPRYTCISLELESLP